MPLFAITSAAAVASGAAVLALAGAGPGVWLRNPVAWIAGAALALVVARVAQASIAAPAMLVISVVGLAITLIAPDVDGVNRWVDAGPLHANVAALLLPAAVVALAWRGLFTALGTAFAAAVALILIAQPDASQASAFLLAVTILAVRQRGSPGRTAATVACAVLAALAAWLRPDPLVPVAEVELIFELAADHSMLLTALVAVALAAACLCPLFAAGEDEPTQSAALALGAYFAATAAAPALGAFPVPLVGLGMSFPVGFWIGVGFLGAVRASRGTEPGVPFEKAPR